MRTTIILVLILVSSLCFGQGNGLYKFQSDNGKFGFMDKKGKIIIKAKYLIVGEFSEGLCYVSKKVTKKDYKWIFIDTLGNKVFGIKNNFPQTEFSEGFAIITNFEKHWFVNKKGQNEFRKSWKDAQGEFKKGIAYVTDIKYGNFYPINTKGERVSTSLSSLVEVYNSKKENSSIIKSEIEFKSDKYVAFKENELFGFKDSLNNIIIEPKYYLVDQFENGVCAVRINKREFEIANDYFLDAIIDEDGKILIEIPMHCYMGFQGELIVFHGSFHFGGGIHYLNKNGQKIIPKH